MPNELYLTNAQADSLRQEPKSEPEMLDVAFRKEMTPTAPSTSSQEGWVFIRIINAVKRVGQRH